MWEARKAADAAPKAVESVDLPTVAASETATTNDAGLNTSNAFEELEATIASERSMHSFAAANDDFESINEHLRYLKQQGSQRSEIVAFWSTLALSFVFAILIKWSVRIESSAWPLVLVVSFIAATAFFMLVATTLRQRTAQTTLATLLRTTAHLAQPELVEQDQLSSLSNSFKAELVDFDRSVETTGERVSQIVAAMNKELADCDERFAALEASRQQSIENLAIERAAIVTNGENLHHVLSRVSADISKDLSTIANDLQTLFESKSQNLVEIIDQRNKSFLKDYLEAEERNASLVKRALDQSLIKTMERYELNNERFLQAIVRRQEDFDEKLDRHSRESDVRVDHQISRFYAKADDVTGEVVKRAEGLFERAEKATEQKTASVTAMLARTIIDLSETFKSNTTQLQDVLGASFKQMDGLTAKNRNIESDLARQIAEFRSSVVDPLDQLTEAFGEKSRTIANQVVIQVTAFNEAAALGASEIEQVCLIEKEKIKESSDDAAREIRRCMETLVQECSEAVGRSLEAAQASMWSGEPDVGRKTEILVEAARPTNGEAFDPEPRQSIAALAEVEQGTVVAPPKSRLIDNQSWISQLLARVDASGEIDPFSAADSVGNRGSITLRPSLSGISEAELRGDVSTTESTEGMETIADVLDNIGELILTEELQAAWATFQLKDVADFSAVFTSKGIKAVNTVKRKLDEEEDTHRFVVSYLEKVERLLQQAYSSYDDSALLSYMSSNNGKVYTLLAYTLERI